MVWVVAEMKTLVTKMLMNRSSAGMTDQTSLTAEMINQRFLMVKEVICEFFKNLLKH